MERLIVTIDNIDNAKMVANMLRQLNFIANVQIEGDTNSEFAKGSKFLYPSHLMNEGDVKQMISECESEPYFSSNEARNLSLKIIKAWEKQNG